MRRPPGDSPQQIGELVRTFASKASLMTPAQLEAEREREARYAADEARKRSEALRRECGVFPRYETAGIRDVELPKARLSAEEYARYEDVRAELATLLTAPGILVLSGDNGPGKTHLASGLVHAFCDAGRKAKYVRASDFFLALKSTFGEPGRTQEDLVRRFERYALLAVDEIEVRSDSNWENVVLRSLIDARYAMCVSTVLITNKTKGELNGEDGATPYLSRALRDRIRHEGGILECRWRSLRGEAGRS